MKSSEMVRENYDMIYLKVALGNFADQNKEVPNPLLAWLATKAQELRETMEKIQGGYQRAPDGIYESIIQHEIDRAETRAADLERRAKDIRAQAQAVAKAPRGI